MKKDNKSALELSFGVHTGETKWKGKSEAKVEQKRRQFTTAPVQDFQVIFMPFQVHFKCSSCP